MSKTYRPKQSLAWTYAVCLAFFLIVGAASVAFFLFEPKFRGAGERLGVAAVIGLFWSAFVAGSVYALAAVRVSELAFSDESLTEKGPLGETLVRYDAVREVRWGWQGPRRIELRTHGGKRRADTIAIDLGAYEPRAALDLIRTVRGKLSHAEQIGWEPFCRKCALPLRDAVDNVKRAPRPDQQVQTRRRWDVLFASAILVCGGAAAGIARATGDASGFGFVALLALMWGALRFSWPREGVVVRRRTPGERRWLTILGGSTVLIVAGWAAVVAVPFLDLSPMAERVVGAWALGVFLAWISVVGWSIVRVGESQKERETFESLGAAEEWEEGEQIVFVERED